MSEPTTVLDFTGLALPPYSARGLMQTLEPLDQAGNLRRTVNGELIDLSHQQFRKYRSTIAGSDQQPPAIDGVWQGLQVVVDCICELAYLAQGGAPQRPVVAGSSRQDGDFMFYRPRLAMRVTAFNVSTDEYGAVTSWSLSLEEI